MHKQPLAQSASLTRLEIIPDGSIMAEDSQKATENSRLRLTFRGPVARQVATVSASKNIAVRQNNT
jgi:hypothetical protein